MLMTIGIMVPVFRALLKFDTGIIEFTTGSFMLLLHRPFKQMTSFGFA